MGCVWLLFPRVFGLGGVCSRGLGWKDGWMGAWIEPFVWCACFVNYWVGCRCDDVVGSLRLKFFFV